MERSTLRRAWGALPLVALALGCATAPPPRGEPAAAAAGDGLLEPPKIRIVDPQLAAARSASSEVVVVPFAPGQNGTELVYALLDRAGHEGARYVADLRMYMTFRWRGTPVECRTSVMLEGDPRLAAAAAKEASAGVAGPYATDVTAYQPQKMEFVADDRELACHKVQVAHNAWKRARDSGRDAEGRRLERIDPESRELVTTVKEGERCEWRPVTRSATRYDYEVKLGFVPPNWDHLQSRFARRKLVPTAPSCYALAEEELAKQPMYRITATAYRRGKVAQRLPDVLPSMGTINPSNVETAMPQIGYDADDCG